MSSRTTLITGILFGPISVRVGGELGLLLGGRRQLRRLRPAGGRRCSGRDRGRRGDAVALFEALDELRQLEHGHLVDRLEQVVLGR